MYRRPLIPGIFAIAFVVSSAYATDFRCNDTPSTLASLPLELRIETSLSNPVKIAGAGFARSQPSQSADYSRLKLASVRWLVSPLEQDNFGAAEKQSASRPQMLKDSQPKILLEVPNRTSGPISPLLPEFQRVGKRIMRLPNGTLIAVPPKNEPRGSKKSPFRPNKFFPPLRPVDGQTGVVAADLNRVSSSYTFNTLKKVFLEYSSCNYEVIGKWETLHSKITNRVLPWTHEQLAREYNLDAPSFLENYGPEITSEIAGYTVATRNLLEACFKSAETTSFVKSSNVLRQMGRITYGVDSVCTATLIGEQRYTITARHCFAKAAQDPDSAKDIWFIPYASSNRYQVCSVAGKDAFASEKFESIDHDQVLVRVAPTSIFPNPIRTISSKDLKTTADEKLGDKSAPMLLASVSYFPLASIVSPQKFPSGYVVPGTEVCAAIAKDKACFAHICGAVGGGSGSPIFAESKNIILAGTHVGGSTETSGPCKQNGSQINAAASMNINDAPLFFSKAAQ